MINYEITDDTMAIIPIEYAKTKIIEKNREYIVDKKAYNIMDENCKYYGSTYKGRLKAAKEILNCSYKLPILVEESSPLIFFPTKSSLEEDCCWINFNSVTKVTKNDNKSIINFSNNKEIITDISKVSIDNQISRSIKLDYIISQRKKTVKK